MNASSDNRRDLAEPATFIDPVCQMPVAPASAAEARNVDGYTFYFCSTACAATFDAAERETQRVG